MKKKSFTSLTRFTCLLLLISLVFSACGFGGTDDNKSKDRTSSMTETADVGETGKKGRYLETKVSLPDNIFYFQNLSQLKDGSYRLLAGTKEDGYLLLQSTDYGRTWQELEQPWLAQFENLIIDQCVFVDNDTAYLTYIDISPEIEETLNKLSEEEKYDEFSALYDEQSRFGKLTNGTLEPLDYNLNFKGEHSYLSTLLPGDEGTLVAIYNDEAVVFDTTTGNPLSHISLNYLEDGATAFYDTTLLVAEEGTLQFYDADTTSKTKEIVVGKKPADDYNQQGWSYRAGSSVVTVNPTTQEIYFFDSSGVYQVTPENDTAEQKIYSDTNSLSMPSVLILDFFQNTDDSFLFLCTDPEHRDYFFLHFEFNDDVPATPSKEITVYSLQNSQGLQQAISMFQIENPDVRVTLELGQDPESGFTPQDAVRNLNTEILAGKGPDVFLLDGMPIESYINKGVLEDLAPLLEKDISAGTYLDNIANTYRKEEALYAIPSRFTTHIIFGTELENLNSLQDLVLWNKEHSPDQPAFLASDLLQFYSVFSSTWFDEQGKLDEGNFSKGMQELETFMQTYEEDDDNSVLGAVRGDAISASIMFKNGKLPLGFATLRSFSVLSAPYSAMTEVDNADLTLFPQQAGGLYTPVLVLGLNAASEEKDAAKDFISFALSTEVLSHSFDEGIPVNREALLASTISPQSDPDLVIGGYGLGFSDPDDPMGAGESYSLDVYWPSEDFMADMIAQIETLSTPSYDNVIVKDIIMNVLQEAIYGEISMDQAEASIKEKLALYLAEQ